MNNFLSLIPKKDNVNPILILLFSLVKNYNGEEGQLMQSIEVSEP